MKCFAVAILLLCAYGSSQSQTFTNPLLPSGPDPWLTEYDGTYYYMHTMSDRLKIWKTRNPVDIQNAEAKVIWNAPDTGEYRSNIWAPELHRLNGKWYVYFAADDGENINHRTWVLVCDGDDPLAGNWELAGRIADPGDHWAIDASVFSHRDVYYMIWSGWEGYENTLQHIYISEMKNPWTLRGKRVMLSSPTAAWELNGLTTDEAAEKKGVFVNEGPQLLKHGSDLFIVFSANGCWTDHYSLGILRLKPDGNVMNADDWEKNHGPVFETSKENSVYAPGHNSFFKSPDGAEDWILYHANSEPQLGCSGRRSPRAQQFTWDADGWPAFGIPVPTDSTLARPSGIP